MIVYRWALLALSWTTVGVVLPLLVDPSPAEADQLGERDKRELFAEDYKAFVDTCRTSMETVAWTSESAAERGFLRVDPVGPQPALDGKPGDRALFVNRGQGVYLVAIGSEPLTSGMNVLAAHLDSPALLLDDLPINGEEVVTLSAHAYGGLKGYQYDSIPLEIRGGVYRRGGEYVPVRLGGDDYAFMARPLDTKPRTSDKRPYIHTFEIIAATVPSSSTARNPVKLTLLQTLHDRYSLRENDLETALLFAVPAWPPRDVGFDRAAIAAYGHDDRACSFVATRALLDRPDVVPKTTAMVILADREETGSDGVTGMRSEFFRMVVGTLLEAQGVRGENALRATLRASKVISADVTVGLNPLFPEVHEPGNAAIVGRGPAMMKYATRGGKYGGSDAHPEFVREIQDLFVGAGVPLQTAEIGRVDEGGGGTLAKYLAHQGADVLDVGIGVLSMHSPLEIVHKRDLHDLYVGFSAFLWETTR